MGLGADALDKKKIKSSIQDISAITGQHPIVTKFKNQSQILSQEKVQALV
jgi:ribosomal protein L5